MNKQGFHVSVKPVTKGNGGSVIAKSAYNSGSKLEDKKANKIHDYTAKTTAKNIELIDKYGVKTTKEIEKNVAYSALIVPKIADKIEVEREEFWNEIELIEKSAKAQLGVEIDVMFPRGLSADQRIELVKEYSQELADRYNILVDVNIHRPHTHIQKKDGQILEITKDNHHAHILLSSREIIQNPDDSYSLSKRKNWGLW
ncbi:MobA/MobL family protein, partial [Psychrobacter celer]